MSQVEARADEASTTYGLCCLVLAWSHNIGKVCYASSSMHIACGSILNDPVPLGLESYVIPDSSLTASSEYNTGYGAERGRLNLARVGSLSGAWSALTNNANQWIQVDLADIYRIISVATQGRQGYSQWVTSYKVACSTNDTTIHTVQDIFTNPGADKIFTGNVDRNTIVTNTLPVPQSCRYVRLMPVSWFDHISLRMEIYGPFTENACLSAPCLNVGTCQQTENDYQCICQDLFIGRNCEIGNYDPCIQRNPCVNGVCHPIEQGQYECECKDHYEGIHCDEPTLPLEVAVHPSSQIININANMYLTCSFNNSKRYHWYKDDVLLPGGENENPLTILSVTPNDIGYYFCRGSGRNGETLDTMRASVYIKDLTNIKVSNARFAIPFRDELYYQTSKLFRETAFNISTYA
ncbi:uncharacterized protein LOC592324 [Strongylocentrotus purpuratus]|uniref:Uncharacterized protein n=1 Tax=Strongylocentrotus purpuratus TaxID=7668 RepID=A0A7M7NBE7_STRPU|nr:uncharacterized protein LOC592324 [Strongylocentrotus purpuratus]